MDKQSLKAQLTELFHKGAFQQAAHLLVELGSGALQLVEAATLPAPTPPSPPVAIDRPPAPALCDPGGGCWTPDGPQLRYVPPGFVGPRGPCIPQGGAMYCP